METPKIVPKPDLRYLFKSYYVVWKLFTGKENNKSGSEFKSYYVVWKLLCK